MKGKTVKIIQISLKKVFLCHLHVRKIGSHTQTRLNYSVVAWFS